MGLLGGVVQGLYDMVVLTIRLGFQVDYGIPVIRNAKE